MSVPNHTPIVGVLETNSKYVFGMSKHNVPLYLFRPFDKNLSEMIVGSKEKNLLQNYIVLVDGPGVPKINDPALNFQVIRGNLNRILGPCGDIKTEAEALLWQHCPVYQKPYKGIFIPYQENFDKRVDLTKWFTINIDPEGCVDIDDCLSYSYDNDKYYFAISISDVASQIDFNAPYAKTAYEIGQSFYSNDTVRTMFPKEVERELSLFPGETRHGVSLIFEWCFERRKIVTSTFQETLLVNKLSLSYEQIMNFNTKYENENVENIREFLRQISGVNDSHAWIEKLMIMYNIEAAKLLQKHKVGIFRKQKESSLYKNDSYLINCCPFLAIEAAEYCSYSEDLKHSILKVDAYTQVTSPIRRYVDLENQRLLKLILKLQSTNNLQILENIQIHLAELRAIDNCVHFNLINRKNKQHDRDLFFLNILMGSKVELDGFVLNIDNELNELTKLRVYIPKWKRIVNIKNVKFSDLVDSISTSNFTMKENVKLDYFYDPTKAGWKHRMVFKIY